MERAATSFGSLLNCRGHVVTADIGRVVGVPASEGRSIKAAPSRQLSVGTTCRTRVQQSAIRIAN